MKKIMLVIALLMGACAGPMHGVHSAVVPTVMIDPHAGSTAEWPWSGFDIAVTAVHDVLTAEYPNNPEYLKFQIEVFGANDEMNGMTVSNIFRGGDGMLHLLAGTTDRKCGGFMYTDCAYIIKIRQTRNQRSYSRGEHIPMFTGSLESADNSALFDEAACRMAPMLTGHWPGGYFEPWLTLKQKMITRYHQLEIPAPKPG